MKKRKENSRTDQILKLVLMYGECPYSVLDVLVYPSEKDRIRKAVYRLKEKGLVRSTGRKAENTKALRFNATQINQDYIEEKYGRIALENIERVTSCYRYSGTNQIDQMRWHRMCETGVMMHKIGLMDYGFTEHRKEKDVNLYGLTDVEAQELGIYSEAEIIAGEGKTDAKGNWFMSSTEYKRKDLRGFLKMTYWRFTGVFFGGGTPYMLYSTGNRLMKFSADAEMRSRYDVEMYVYDREPHLRLLNKREGQTLNTAIFFGAPGTDLPYQYLARNENGQATTGDRNIFSLRNVNRVFTNVCFVPLDGNGLRQMKMYLRHNWRDEMFNIYEGLEPVKLDEYEEYYDARAYDALDDQGRYVLFFLDGNLHNLYRFKMFKYNDPEHKHVVCFPWQEELVKQYMHSPLVAISTCEPEDLEEYLGDG